MAEYFKWRRTIGIGCLVIGGLLLYMTWQIIQTQGYYPGAKEIFSGVDYILLAWIIISISCKFNMILHLFDWRLNVASLVLWVILAFTNFFNPGPNTAKNIIYNLTNFLFWYGWIIVDSLDVLIHKYQKIKLDNQV